ncbi:hypothetical protein [Caulobacter sp. UNC279MFTsu5.1]|uniref:hypothetical protein n=1 Tax=Caulobacter sp. UNC279MFTsu5.1 TaxID=1502775 RepID=UPI001160A0A5|nr:hypothetical protein [Caulobacter sp. UNC279MFTsu5.1]
MTNNPIVPPQDQHDDLFQRLIWTGTATNGASFLALSNIVANAPNQDTALAALTIPMFLLGSGLVVGGIAIWNLLYMRALRMSEAIYFRKSMNAMDRSKLIKPAVSEMPISLELAKIVYGDQAEDEIRRLYKNIVDVHIKGHAEADADFKSAQGKQKDLTVEISRANEGAKLWHNMSLALCAAGLVWALAQQNFGVYLNGPTKSAGKVSQESPIEKERIESKPPSQNVGSAPKKIGPTP